MLVSAELNVAEVNERSKMHSIFKLLMTLSLQGRQELRFVFLFTAMHAFLEGAHLPP